MKRLTAISLFSFMAAAIFGQTASPADLQKAAEAFAAAYNAKEYARIEETFGPQMKAAVPAEKLTEFLNGTHEQFGKTLKVGTGTSPQPGVIVSSAQTAPLHRLPTGSAPPKTLPHFRAVRRDDSVSGPPLPLSAGAVLRPQPLLTSPATPPIRRLPAG